MPKGVRRPFTEYSRVELRDRLDFLFRRKNKARIDSEIAKKRYDEAASEITIMRKSTTPYTPQDKIRQSNLYSMKRIAEMEWNKALRIKKEVLFEEKQILDEQNRRRDINKDFKAIHGVTTTQAFRANMKAKTHRKALPYPDVVPV